MWNDVIIMTDNRIYADVFFSFKFFSDLILNMANTNRDEHFFCSTIILKMIIGILRPKHLRTATLNDALVL